MAISRGRYLGALVDVGVKIDVDFGCGIVGGMGVGPVKGLLLVLGPLGPGRGIFLFFFFFSPG